MWSTAAPSVPAKYSAFLFRSMQHSLAGMRSRNAKEVQKWLDDPYNSFDMVSPFYQKDGNIFWLIYLLYQYFQINSFIQMKKMIKTHASTEYIMTSRWMSHNFYLKICNNGSIWCRRKKHYFFAKEAPIDLKSDFSFCSQTSLNRLNCFGNSRRDVVFVHLFKIFFANLSTQGIILYSINYSLSYTTSLVVRIYIYIISKKTCDASIFHCTGQFKMIFRIWFADHVCSYAFPKIAIFWEFFNKFNVY